MTKVLNSSQIYGQLKLALIYNVHLFILCLTYFIKDVKHAKLAMETRSTVRYYNKVCVFI